MNTRFFDYNATTALCPEAKAAWIHAVDALWLNPSSPYRAAARVHAYLEQARDTVAARFGVPSERLVFNSGATEGNNAVLAHWAASLPVDAVIGLSPTEHPSVIEAAKHFFAGRILWLALDACGAVDIDAIPFTQISALSVMAANNETGLMNPWREIAAAAKAAGVVFHCDASQWVGKMPLEGLRDCDYVTICGHKFGGPKGVGVCLVPGTSVDFIALHGGAQESGHRAGTEDVAAVLAMVAALEQIPCGEVGSSAGRESLLAALPEFELVGAGGARLWNTALLIAPEFASVRWIRALEKRGFLISAGSACSTGKEGPSHVLAAMGFDADQMRRSLRISSGPDAELQDWLDLAAAIRAVYTQLREDAQGSGSGVISI